MNIHKKIYFSVIIFVNPLETHHIPPFYGEEGPEISSWTRISVYYNLGLIFVVLVIIFNRNDNSVLTKVIAKI